MNLSVGNQVYLRSNTYQTGTVISLIPLIGGAVVRWNSGPVYSCHTKKVYAGFMANLIEAGC